MRAFWLVLSCELLKDRRIDDDSTRFKFDSCVILWTNHNSLLSIATNQFPSFCIGNKSLQSAIFVSVKVSKFEIKRFFPYILILYYIKQIAFHVTVRLLSNRSKRTSKCGKHISDTLDCASCATFLFLSHFDVPFDLLLSRRTATWNLFVK